MTCHKIRGNLTSCVFRSLLKAPKRYLSVGADLVWSLSFVGCIAVLCQFLFQANLACFNEIYQNVNDFVSRDKVE